MLGRYLGGYIAAAFFAVGAPAALFIGYLCDKMNRRNLLFIVVILGALLTCPLPATRCALSAIALCYWKL